MFNMLDMLGKVKDMQSKLALAQEEAKALRYSYGAQGIHVIVSGDRQIVSLDLSAASFADAAEQSNAITTVVNTALAEIDRQSRQLIKDQISGSLPNVPGLDFSSLFGV